MLCIVEELKKLLVFRVEDVNIVQNAFRFRILQIYSNLPVDEAFIQTEIGTF